jgi:hypothetical protein
MVFDFENREVVLRADFDAVEDDNLVKVPVRFEEGGPRPPRGGEWIYLLDGHGGGCVGRCSSVRDGVARIRLVWETWTGPDAPPRPPRRDWGGVHKTIVPPAAREHGGVHPTL